MADKEKKESQQNFVRRPNRDIRFRTSKDGKYVMIDITETWFFSARYISKIADNASKQGSGTTTTNEE